MPVCVLVIVLYRTHYAMLYAYIRGVLKIYKINFDIKMFYIIAPDDIKQKNINKNKHFYTQKIRKTKEFPSALR